jgi:uncharacterized oligopeptide transporter (OPT) family protein
MRAFCPHSPQSALRTAPGRASPQTEQDLPMSLVSLVVTLIVVGILLWLVNTYLPMDRKIKTILNVVVVIFVILWILNGTGVLGGLNGITVGG